MTAPFVGEILKGVVIQYLPLFGEFWCGQNPVILREIHFSKLIS